jgi:hypothetical protein
MTGPRPLGRKADSCPQISAPVSRWWRGPFNGGRESAVSTTPEQAAGAHTRGPVTGDRHIWRGVCSVHHSRAGQARAGTHAASHGIGSSCFPGVHHRRALQKGPSEDRESIGTDFRSSGSCTAATSGDPTRRAGCSSSGTCSRARRNTCAGRRGNGTVPFPPLIIAPLWLTSPATRWSASDPLGYAGSEYGGGLPDLSCVVDRRWGIPVR